MGKLRPQGQGSVAPESTRPGAAAGAVCPGALCPPASSPLHLELRAQESKGNTHGPTPASSRGLLLLPGPSSSPLRAGPSLWHPLRDAEAEAGGGGGRGGRAAPHKPTVPPWGARPFWPGDPPGSAPVAPGLFMRRQMGTRKGAGMQGRVSGFPNQQGGPCSDFPKCVSRSSPSSPPEEGMGSVQMEAGGGTGGRHPSSGLS